MVTHDVITGGPINALLSMTGLPAVEPVEGVAAPPLTHWLFCRDEPPMQALGTDGHRSMGGLLPTPALHRRMWAGGHLEFFRPIRLGAAVTRRSQVVTSEEREGRTGKLTIVQLNHELSDGSGPLLRERQDIVFREAAISQQSTPTPAPAPARAHWEVQIDPTPVMLFRYSALTFNSHRIHYDRDYAIRVEGYPGLVVQGPLTATFLLHAAVTRNGGSEAASFSFRAVSPMFDDSPFYACGSPAADGSAHLFARNASGGLCMDGSVTFRR